MALPQDLIARLFINGINQGKLINVHSTVAGTAYLTDDHIQSVIAAHLEEKEGQASTFELCSKLDIERELLRYVLTKYEQERGWTVVNDTILTRSRQEVVVADINKDVAEHGYISVTVKAQALGLPYQYLQKLADSGVADRRIHTNGTLTSPGLLMSEDFVNNNIDHLKNILQQATEPLPIQKVQKETDIPAALFFDLFEHVAKVEETNGFVRGRRENAIFVPNVYRDGQVSKIRQFVESNDYIDYQRLNSYHLYNVSPRDLLVSQFPDIQLLATCAVTSNIKLIISAEIDEILGSRHWINVTTLVPPILASQDISILIGTITDEKNDSRLVRLGSTFVTTKEWLDTCYESLQQGMQLKALGAKNAKADMEAIPKKQKQKRGRQASYDQYELSEDELREALLKSKDMKIDAEFGDLVISHLFPRAKREYTNMIQSVYLPTSQHASEEKSKLHLQQLNGHLAEFWCRFRLLLKATAVFEDSGVQSSLSKHLLRTLGLELVDTLITYHAYLDQRKTFVPAFDQCLDIPWKISVEDHQREELLNGMRVEDQANAAKARGIATAGKPSEVFIKLIDKLLSSYEITMADIEQMQSRCSKHIASNLVQQLSGASGNNAAAAPLILHLAVLIYFQALYKLPLHASGKFVPKIIRQLTPRLRSDDRAEDAETIECCQKAIMRALGANNVYTDEELALLKSTKEMGIRVATELE